MGGHPVMKGPVKHIHQGVLGLCDFAIVLFEQETRLVTGEGDHLLVQFGLVNQIDPPLRGLAFINRFVIALHGHDQTVRKIHQSACG